MRKFRARLRLNKKYLVYIPNYNSGLDLVDIIFSIPEEIQFLSNILVLDNQSNDESIHELIKKLINEYKYNNIVIIQPEKNLGYAGSQKLAYTIATNQNEIEKVIMLHSDGQYPAECLKLFIPFFSKNNDIVYGRRDKIEFPDVEETPLFTYYVIKLISYLASIISGKKFDEWVSGFRMYDINFLRKIDYNSLSKKPVFDCEMLILSSLNNDNTKSFPIYKKYVGKIASFTGVSGIKLVLDIINTSFKARTDKYKSIAGKKNNFKHNYKIIFNNIFIEEKS